jgi:hypothetical protein
VLQIVREVDCRHPALAQFAVEAVAVAQGTGKLGTKVGCRSRLENGLQLMLLRGTPIASRGAGLVAPAGDSRNLPRPIPSDAPPTFPAFLADSQADTRVSRITSRSVQLRYCGRSQANWTRSTERSRSL